MPVLINPTEVSVRFLGGVRLLLACFITTIAGLAVQPADARNLVFHFRNISGSPLQYQLYAQERRVIWPGTTQVYILPPSGKIFDAAISCQQGEHVCFGAWIEGRDDFYWGVGKNSQQSCTDCCFACKGRSTNLVTFNPPNLAKPTGVSPTKATSDHPSFDCGDASLNEAERTICGNGVLSKLDLDVSRSYNQLMSEQAQPEALRNDQRNFLKKRNACGADASCLNKLYWNRFNELQWIIGESASGD
jgi:uncharacterized protein YecT (DUF1311 family)